MTQKIHPLAPPEDQLVLHANAIRSLGKRVIADIIEIGRHLTEAKTLAGHGNWLPWLEREFSWSEQSANRFMQGYALSLKSPNVGNLTIDLSTFYRLAAPSAPPEIVAEIVERAEAGEEITRAEISSRLRPVTMHVTQRTLELPVVYQQSESTPLFPTPPTIDQTVANDLAVANATPEDETPREDDGDGVANATPIREPCAASRGVVEDAENTRQRLLHVAEAVNGILKFGRAAEAGIDILIMREWLSEKECEDAFLDALEQAVDLLRWLKPKQ